MFQQENKPRRSTWTRRRTRLLALGAAIGGSLVLAISAGAALAQSADAVTTTVTATTHVLNRPDSGHGGNWAYDSFTRTLTVTVAPVQNEKDTTAGLIDYNATITDVGFFSTVGGAGTPSQFVPGAKILHNGVHGTVNGTYALTVTAPVGDGLSGVVPATEDDNFGAAKVSTGNWPELAFATSTGVTVTGGAYEWDYATACEKWVDSSANGDGNTAGDGNITGKICGVPYVYAGHVVTVSEHNATVGWSDSKFGWPSSNHCVEVYVYGFDRPAGVAHKGFTCDNGNPAANVGYMEDLPAGHTFALFVQPATGTYGNNHPLPGTDPEAHITVITPAA